VLNASWSGPQDVPLEQIDTSGRAGWKASGDTAKVDTFVQKIQTGDKKPIILVSNAGNGKLMIADGHHRFLAYERLGLPPYAYVGVVDSAADWQAAKEMHAQGSNG